MRTLYIDINNKPIQNTDEIICVSDNETLLNDFFYELGCSILSKSGINVPKAQLISGFNLPENVDAYAKIIKQWEDLKAILFGNDVEGEFNVHLPKEYMSWLGNHSNQDYRTICRNKNYDCTQEHIVTIDVEDFYNEYVNDDFIRSLIKTLQGKKDIEQIVFNDNIVTSHSKIVNDICKKNEVIFTPYKSWEKPKRESAPQHKELNTFFVIIKEDKKDTGFRIKVFDRQMRVLIDDYFDECYCNYNKNEDAFLNKFCFLATTCAVFFKNKLDETWTKVSRNGIENVRDKNSSNSSHPRNCIKVNDNAVLVHTKTGSGTKWFLSYFDGRNETILENNQNLNPVVFHETQVIKFCKKHYYDVISKMWYDYVLGKFGIVVEDNRRCKIYSLINHKRILEKRILIYHKPQTDTEKVDSRELFLTTSLDGEVGWCLDKLTERNIVFNTAGDCFEIPKGQIIAQYGIHDGYLAYKDCVVTKDNNGKYYFWNLKGELLLEKDLDFDSLWKSYGFCHKKLVFRSNIGIGFKKKYSFHIIDENFNIMTLKGSQYSSEDTEVYFISNNLLYFHKFAGYDTIYAIERNGECREVMNVNYLTYLSENFLIGQAAGMGDCCHSLFKTNGDLILSLSNYESIYVIE